MAIIYILLGVAISSAVFIAVLFFLLRSNKNNEKIIGLEQKLEEKANFIVSNFNQRLDQRLAENRESIERTSGQLVKNVADFSSNVGELKQQVHSVFESLKNISSFQEIFKAPKLRGKWGEASLNHLLSQYFPKELYEEQYHFRATDALVDAALRLPDGRLLPIDAKFPLENFQKDEKLFIGDVKNQIDDVSKKYILPSENTVDVALMYVPAEAIYYEIVNNSAENFDLNQYAWSKKVILVSPNTFYLTIQVVRQWYKDVKVSKDTQQILQKISRMIQDSEKLQNSFGKLGKHLNDTRGAFEDSQQRLELMTNRMEGLIEHSAEHAIEIKADANKKLPIKKE